VDAWRRTRAAIHEEVCRRGWSERRQSFVKRYDGDDLDACLLLLPRTGFLAGSDPRVRGTVAAIERELARDGLVWRLARVDGGARPARPDDSGVSDEGSHGVTEAHAGRPPPDRRTEHVERT